MKESLCRMAEEWYGIKTDPDDIERLQNHLFSGGANTPDYDKMYSDTNVLERFFSSGEASSFLTVNETYFFREPVHFSLLQELLPSFNQSAVRICSAAASAGCEAYSIAMLIEMYNRNAEKPVLYQIDAFDINPKVIETACRGIYSQNTLREDGSCFSYLSDLYLKKNNYNIYVEQELKNKINFFVHNLLDGLKTDYYDVIFFRNAFIYILPDYRERVLTNLLNSLKENGVLIMGVSETAAVYHRYLEQKVRRPFPQKEDVFFFQKNTYKKPAAPDYFTNALLEKSAVPAGYAG
ncbi:MAG: hypothetical protein FWB83_03375 [Treponema sp.]|nr:hypothetical protein [Treponema sp.]